jgi:hypothetical protein
MLEEHSFSAQVNRALSNGETVEELYAKSSRFGSKNWETVGMCLTAESGARTPLLSHFEVKTIILPRRARDKHRKRVEGKGVFVQTSLI